MRRTLWVLVGLAFVTCGPAEPTGDRDGSTHHYWDTGPQRDANTQDAGDSGLNGCAEATYSGEQEPAAILVVLDRSSSMGTDNKFVFAANAIVQALDYDLFDTMYVGLYSAPTSDIAGPACVGGLQMGCASPAFPQVELTLAGTNKSSDSSGPRFLIKDYMSTEGTHVEMWGGDASPLYNAIQAALMHLQAWTAGNKRILLVVTDGSISCAQLSSRAGFPDCNGCDHDWEHPQNIIDMLAAANTDGTSPVESFVVGVPGADTNDPTGCNFPPYAMRLALSAMAYAGAPNYVPSNCDGTSFSQSGADPTVSCHFDMTQSFTTQDLADAIAFIRGETVGCVFEMPDPGGGQIIDTSEVNVTYVADGNEVELARRGDPNNPCDTTGCWDYTLDNRIELIGAACDEIKSAGSVEVTIIVGCETIVR